MNNPLAISNMEKSHFTKLAKVLYRITEFFPRQEPLRFFIREKANEILADSVLISFAKKEKNEVLVRILSNIEILQTYFKLAQHQNWVKKENFLVLGQEYNKIRQEISQKLTGKGEGVGENIRVTPTKPAREEVAPDLKNRQRKILRVLGEKQPAQVRDFEKTFPEVTKRTLRRDFEELLKKGLVKRLGDKNNTVYKLR